MRRILIPDSAFRVGAKRAKRDSYLVIQRKAAFSVPTIPDSGTFWVLFKL
jgi:hypothetical protein